MRKKVIIISAGGTGGHIFPGIAIADAIKSIDKSIKIIFVGSEDKSEMKILPKYGYHIIGLPLIMFSKWFILRFIFNFFKSIVKSFIIIFNYKPDIVLGLGGYSSFSILFVAGFFKKNITTYLYEANAIPGLTNRLLSNNAKIIFGSYKKLLSFKFKNKVMLLGNPIRCHAINLINKKEAIYYFNFSIKKTTLLFIGGSGGAEPINNFIFNNLDFFYQKDIQIICQIGINRNSDLINKAYKFSNIRVYNFIEDINIAYSASDIIISRAGSGSISELCFVGKPVILIPSSFVKNNHQYYNAIEIVNNNAAILVKDENINNDLIKVLIHLINNDDKQRKLSYNIKKLYTRNAAINIANILIQSIA